MLKVVLLPHFKFQKEQCMYMAMARLTCAIVALHKSRGKSTGYAINEVCTFHVGDMRAWKWKWNLRNENGVQRKNGGWHHRGSQKKIKNLGKWTCHPLLWFFLYPNIKLGPFTFSHFDPYSSLNDTTFNSF